jgi:hypothetical protein
MKTQAVVLSSQCLRRAVPAAMAAAASWSIRARADRPVLFVIRSTVLAETGRLPVISSIRSADRANGASLAAAATALSSAADVVRPATPSSRPAGKNPTPHARQ